MPLLLLDLLIVVWQQLRVLQTVSAASAVSYPVKIAVACISS